MKNLNYSKRKKLIVFQYIVINFLLITNINGTILPGNNSWGNDISYYAFFSGTLDKPIIILEGFDILDNYDESDLYSNWNAGNFINSTYSKGYDIICVNFNQNSQNLHLNKELIKDLIKDVNNSKVGNQEGILIGESMGGIIARMALKELENESYDHQMGLYISYDAPHRGANIPIGFQTGLETVNDMWFPELLGSGFLGIFTFICVISESNTELLEEKLNSIACQQLLVKHIKGNSYFNSLQTYLDNIGYPEETRNISLASGSNTAQTLDFEPGARIFYHTNYGNCWFVNEVTIEINMTDINSHQKVSDISAKIPPCITIDGGAKYADTGPQCYDNCPGGIFSTYGYSTEGIDYFSFVPTVSAIDLDPAIINGTDGLKYFNSQSGRTKDDIINSNLSPFDDIYSNSTNSGHISLNQLSSQVYNILEREVMLDELYIQNREIQHDRTFINDTRITVGSSVNIWPGKNWDEGEVIFKSGSTIELISDEIILDEGTTVELDCVFSAQP